MLKERHVTPKRVDIVIKTDLNLKQPDQIFKFQG